MRTVCLLNDGWLFAPAELEIRWLEPYNPWGRVFDDLVVGGYLKGEAVAVQRIDSSHRAHALTLAADTDRLQADGADMTRLAVRTTDRYGNILPYTICAVEFALEGDAALVGPIPLPMVGEQAALYVKAGRLEGPVRITASAPGLPSASVTLTLEHPKLPSVEGEEH